MYPSAARFITRDFYVDDGLASVESAKQAKDLIQEALEICNKAGVRLHKFIANDCEVLESVSESERAMDSTLDLPSEELSFERVLVNQWTVDLACFGFSIVLKDQPLTRRGLLATVSSVYDPLRFLAPLVLRTKKILQEICRRGVSWVSLCVKTFGQGGSGKNLISCVSSSYKFQDASSRRQTIAKRRGMSYTILLMQARPDTDNAPTLE